MSDPYIAEIRIFPTNFAPTGWAFCQGQILPISQNTALFSLLGTTYGGNGQTTFALPDLRGRAAISPGQGNGLSNRSLGEQTGSETVSLSTSEIPVHNHGVNCFNDTGFNQSPGGNVLAASGTDRDIVMYSDGTTGGTVNMNSSQLSPNGSGMPHNNMSPYLTLSYCIALQGIFPPRS